jgi:epoxyqueuosine reductase
VRSENIKRIAVECGFDLVGVAAAEPLPEGGFYSDWVRAGRAGEMRYLTDRRGDLRADPRTLLASARSIVCVGVLYNGPEPHSTEFSRPELAWISRYAWGDDYHDVLRRRLELLAARLQAECGEQFEW